MSEQETLPHPPVATRDEWLAQRTALLQEEKANTRDYDRLNAKRRRLPMVPVEKNYVFQTPSGPKSLLELFGDKHQLIVQHFMFDTEWDKGCPGCTSFTHALGDIDVLPKRDTEFVIVSRAPLEKLEKYRAEKGWPYLWVSSNGNDFNYDFHVTLDEKVAPREYNFKPAEGENMTGEMPGVSVFFRVGDQVYHTYSTFARGVERATDAYSLLDLTPYGRQEDFEDSPEGWPQTPTYG